MTIHLMGGGGDTPLITAQWDASTNTPDLTTLSPSPSPGDVFLNVAPGINTVDLGNGPEDWEQFDKAQFVDDTIGFIKLNKDVKASEVSNDSDAPGVMVSNSLEDLHTRLLQMLGGSLELDSNLKAVLQADSSFFTASSINESDLTDTTGTPVLVTQIESLTDLTGVSLNGITTSGIITAATALVYSDDFSSTKDTDFFIVTDSALTTPPRIRYNDGISNVYETSYAELDDVDGLKIWKATVPANQIVNVFGWIGGGSGDGEVGKTFRFGVDNPITYGKLKLSASVLASLLLADTALQESDFLNGSLTKIGEEYLANVSAGLAVGVSNLTTNDTTNIDLQVKGAFGVSTTSTYGGMSQFGFLDGLGGTPFIQWNSLPTMPDNDYYVIIASDTDISGEVITWGTGGTLSGASFTYESVDKKNYIWKYTVSGGASTASGINISSGANIEGNRLRVVSGAVPIIGGEIDLSTGTKTSLALADSSLQTTDETYLTSTTNLTNNVDTIQVSIPTKWGIGGSTALGNISNLGIMDGSGDVTFSMSSIPAYSDGTYYIVIVSSTDISANSVSWLGGGTLSGAWTYVSKVGNNYIWSYVVTGGAGSSNGFTINSASNIAGNLLRVTKDAFPVFEYSVQPTQSTKSSLAKADNSEILQLDATISGSNINVVDLTGYDASRTNVQVNIIGTIGDNFTLTMPPVTSTKRKYIIKDTGGNGLSAPDYTLKLVPDGTDLIDESHLDLTNEFEFDSDYESQTFISNFSLTKWEAI